MAQFKPREFFYHSCDAAAATQDRLSLPLHYHLRRGDIIAFRKELRSGTSPLVVDSSGKTPLELVIEQVECMITNALCTSCYADDLYHTLKFESVFPAKFAKDDGFREQNGSFYSDHQADMYASLHKQRGDARVYKLPNPMRAPRCHNGLPGHAFDIIDTNDTSKKGREKSFETMTLIAVEDCVNKPLSFKLARRMVGALQRLKVMVDLMQELVTCDLLLCAVRERRDMTYATGKTGGEATEKAPLWIPHMCLPYGYIATMKILLEMYPRAPDGVEWDPAKPTDMRCLAGIVVRLDLPGKPMIVFLSEATECLAKVLRILPAAYFKPSASVKQYLLNMAYVLDVPDVFGALLSEPVTTKEEAQQLLAESPFNWRDCYDEMMQRITNATQPFLAVLSQHIGKQGDLEIILNATNTHIKSPHSQPIQ